MKAKNYEAFVVLIERYESITLTEIKNMGETGEVCNMEDVANLLTGFGERNDCPLCKETLCFECVYGGLYNCAEGKNAETYEGISRAETPDELLKAFRARAKHMRTLIDK